MPTSEMPWIVLSSANGSTNLGDEAMWQAAAQAVRRELGPVPIVTDARDGWVPPIDGVEVLPFLHHSLRRGRYLPERVTKTRAGAFLERAASVPLRNRAAARYATEGIATPTRAQRNWQLAIERCAGVVVSGAGAMTDDYAPHGVFSWWLVSRWARNAGKPVALIGQGIGPLRGAAERRAAGELLASADYLTVRESGSLEVLRSLPGNARADAFVEGDWALALEPTTDDREKAEEIIAEVGRGRPVVAISFHRRHNTSRATLRRLSVMFETLAAEALEAGAKVIFVPNMTDSGYSDDRSTAMKVVSHWSPNIRAGTHIQHGRLTPGETRALLGRVAGLVCTRYHPMVFALGEGTPVIGLAFDDYYEQKLKGASEIFGVRGNVLRIDSTGPTLSMLRSVTVGSPSVQPDIDRFGCFLSRRQ